MTSRELFIVVLFSFASHVVAAQETFKYDSVSLVVGLGTSIDSILSYFGKPKEIDTFSHEPDAHTHLFASGILVWFDADGGHTRAIEVSSPLFETSTGIRVDDSLAKVIRVYGDGTHQTDFSRGTSDYDTTFRDFADVYFYEYGDDNSGWFVVFYTKNMIVTRIFIYSSGPGSH